MTTKAYTVGDTLYGEIGIWRPEKDQVKLITGSKQAANPWRKRAAGEYGLKSEAVASSFQFVQSRQHPAAST